MEGFWLVGCVDFDLIEGSQNFVVDGTPSIVFDTLVPAFVLVVLGFVKFNVYRLFL